MSQWHCIFCAAFLQATRNRNFINLRPLRPTTTAVPGISVRPDVFPHIINALQYCPKPCQAQGTDAAGVRNPLSGKHQLAKGCSVKLMVSFVFLLVPHL